MMTLEQYGRAAKEASYILAQASPSQKNQALAEAARILIEETKTILEANERDLTRAKEKGMTEAMQDRLRLTEARINGIAEGVRQVIELADPIGEIVEGTKRPNGLEIIKKRVPLGVLGIIYEARPNVTADAAALSIKSGNVCILRGGSEAIHSNLAISRVFRKALACAGLPEDCVQLIEDTSHETAQGLMRMNEYVDVLIDGPFIEELKDTKLHWRGSANQKIYRKVNGEWRVDDEDNRLERGSAEAGKCSRDS